MSEYIREDRERRAREDIRRREQQRESRDDRARETPSRSQDRDEMDSMSRLADVVNDPDIEIDTPMMKAINDPDVVMMPSGEVAKVTRRMSRSRGRAPSFRRDLILPRTNKKRKKNPKLAKAFAKANGMGRKKNGGFKKGWSQSKIASTAHRLLRQGKI